MPWLSVSSCFIYYWIIIYFIEILIKTILWSLIASGSPVRLSAKLADSGNKRKSTNANQQGGIATPPNETEVRTMTLYNSG